MYQLLQVCQEITTFDKETKKSKLRMESSPAKATCDWQARRNNDCTCAYGCHQRRHSNVPLIRIFPRLVVGFISCENRLRYSQGRALHTTSQQGFFKVLLLVLNLISSPAIFEIAVDTAQTYAEKRANNSASSQLEPSTFVHPCFSVQPSFK